MELGGSSTASELLLLCSGFMVVVLMSGCGVALMGLRTKSAKFAGARTLRFIEVPLRCFRRITM